MSANKVYERQWSIARGNELVVENGASPKAFVLGFPHEGQIEKIVCKQSDGTDKAFAIKVFNSRPPAAYDEDGSSELAGTQFDEDLSLVAELNAVAGAVAKNEDTSGFAFQNQDGTPTNPVREIYVEITVTGQADDCSFDLAIAIAPAIP